MLLIEIRGFHTGHLLKHLPFAVQNTGPKWTQLHCTLHRCRGEVALVPWRRHMYASMCMCMHVCVLCGSPPCTHRTMLTQQGELVGYPSGPSWGRGLLWGAISFQLGSPGPLLTWPEAGWTGCRVGLMAAPNSHRSGPSQSEDQAQDSPLVPFLI